MRAYSDDLRSRVLADVLAGTPPAAVADRYRVSPSWVRRVRQRHRDHGEVGPRPGGHRRQRLAADADRLQAAVAADSDATLAELKARLGLAVVHRLHVDVGRHLGRGLAVDPGEVREQLRLVRAVPRRHRQRLDGRHRVFRTVHNRRQGWCGAL